jgi:DMSO/TMAO reductase YedYZ molybdopterin-dependent catalytic subunit
MDTQKTRRDVLKGSLAVAGLSLFGIPEWALPVMAQGETLVPFTDLPDNFNPNPAPDRRLLDQFFTTQHYGHPEVDLAAFRLKVGGLVNTPLTLSIDDLKKLGPTDIVAGFECSGNRRPLQGLSGNGKWTGVPLKTVLERAGLKANAREIVFFGADRGTEEIEWRTSKYTLEQQFGRSLPRDKAISGEPMVVWAMNGEPLTKHQGASSCPAGSAWPTSSGSPRSTRRKTSTSASSRRAGTARCAAR